MMRMAASKWSQGEYFSERNSDVVFFVLHKVFEIAFFRVGIQNFAVPFQEGPDWYVILVTPLGVTTGSTEATNFYRVHNFVSKLFLCFAKFVNSEGGVVFKGHPIEKIFDQGCGAVQGDVGRFFKRQIYLFPKIFTFCLGTVRNYEHKIR